MIHTLDVANSQFQKIRDTIQNLEEALAKATKLQEEKMILQSMKVYLTKDEIELMDAKSKAKVEDALIIHKLIELEKQKLGYLTDQDINTLSEAIQAFKSNLGGIN